MLGLEHLTGEGSAGVPSGISVPRVHGPHVSEAKIYLGRIRLGVIGFYAVTLLALLLWLPILAVISGATALCGSLLLQSDPLLEPFMTPVMLQLGHWVLTLPEWVRYPVKDGLLYLTPLTICCCLGCASACAELFFAIPSHSTGLGGTIRPLVALTCGCLHVTVFACCWHCRSLIWRPHGSVAYADLYEAAMDVGRPDSEDMKPATSTASANVTDTQVQKVHLEALHHDPPRQPLAQDRRHPETVANPSPVAPLEPQGGSGSSPHSNDGVDATVEPTVSQLAMDASVELLLRLPSGRRVRCHFRSSDRISKIYDAVEAEATQSEPEIRNGSPYCLVTIHPKQAFQDKYLTLAEAGLQNSTVLNVEMTR
ncbi:unnamed protein product [Durusdinium trenchii]|uniref:Chloroplastic n=2 Tax=Durusdinium trenchii TaxID=1381693 RepID=A0ABP0K7Y0_9DINO